MHDKGELMAIYNYPEAGATKCAYTWFGTHVPTPEWFDDNENVGPAWLSRVFGWCRSVGVVSLIYPYDTTVRRQ